MKGLRSTHPESEPRLRGPKEPNLTELVPEVGQREAAFNKLMEEREEANRKREEDIARREWAIEGRRTELRQEMDELEARLMDIKRQKKSQIPSCNT